MNVEHLSLAIELHVSVQPSTVHSHSPKFARIGLEDSPFARLTLKASKTFFLLPWTFKSYSLGKAQIFVEHGKHANHSRASLPEFTQPTFKLDRKPQLHSTTKTSTQTSDGENEENLR